MYERVGYFEPDTVAAMGHAYDATLAWLAANNRRASDREAIAQFIVELASRGATSATRMAADTTRQFACAGKPSYLA